MTSSQRSKVTSVKDSFNADARTHEGARFSGKADGWDGLAHWVEADGLRLSAYDSQIGLACGTVNGSGNVGRLWLKDLKQYVALVQHKPSWVSPCYGSNETELAELEQEAYFLLGETKVGYVLLLPLIGNGLRVELQGFRGGVAVHVDCDSGEAGATGEQPLVLVATDPKDPYRLVHRAMQAAADVLGTFSPRWEKPEPAYLDLFGWCTWDAFYRDVTFDGVLQGLQALRAGGVQPGFVILDDGWQTVHERQMVRFDADDVKFPGGLKSLVERVKSEFDVKVFGLWHTLAGYWQGVSPDGPLGECYDVARSNLPLRKADGQELPHGWVVRSKDVGRFYNDFYGYLAAQGVDMTKVDNQNAMANFQCNGDGANRMVCDYQQALQQAASEYLPLSPIHCMCNRNDVAYRMSRSNVWRNSDDFFPTRPESHQRHVFINAINNLWSSGFAVPDWDMFHSRHSAGGFHAMARAISGGPVYISDKPGEHDFDLIKKLCLSNGHVLRSRQPAMPTRDRLFTDCLREPKLLKVFNRNGDAGTLGLFHCQQEEYRKDSTICDTFSAHDIPDLDGEEFALYCETDGSVTWTGRHDVHQVELPPLGATLMAFIPVRRGVGVIGLVDKFNASAGVLEQRWLDDKTLEIVLADGGELGVASRRPLRLVSVAGCLVDQVEPIQPSNGLCRWTITRKGKTRVHLSI